MAQGIISKKTVEYFFAIIVIILFFLVTNRYVSFGFIRKNQIATIHKSIINYYHQYYGTCEKDKIKINVKGGFLCRENAEKSDWLTIFETYPKSANGREVIYSFIDKGDIDYANDYIDNLYPVARFDPVKIDSQITWEENPYDSKYWRFIFYSLRPTTNLLYAEKKTGDHKYTDKLKEITSSFLDDGMDKKYTWDDNHAVAFRTLVLTDIWWKLREANELPIDLSTKILKSLKIHGDFLLDENHYEPQHNHGINESAALLVLAENFPSMQNSDKWLSTAKERLESGLNDLVDDDGILVENSPYYHFYSLEKYWEILKYSKQYDVQFNRKFEDKIQKMIDYTAYILQPNSEVPLLGASIKRKINYEGFYKEMAEKNPYLLYVLSHGKEGKVPPKLNAQYEVAGQTIMRSGWGDKNSFDNQTQLIFNVGSYRSTHSHFDALGFSLYGDGESLLPDSGLYTYQHNALRNYFYGTSAHNTVVVDNSDQRKGSVNIGESYEGDGYFYQSAQHELYPGVKHERAITLIGDKIVLIIDNLKSNDEHLYSQKFHLSPELNLSMNGLTARGLDQNSNQRISINQFLL